jgi:hypothetical protein
MHKWTEEDHLNVQLLKAEGFTTRQTALELGLPLGSVIASARRVPVVIEQPSPDHRIEVLEMLVSELQAQLKPILKEREQLTPGGRFLLKPASP